MSAQRAKVFGMDLGVDPKVVVLALIVLAGAVYYFTSSSGPSSGSGTGNGPTAANPPVARPPLTASQNARTRRLSRVDRDVLKFVPVDGSRGDIDPTLRLRLLERVKNVPPAAGLRNLFDAAGPVLAQNMPPIPAHPPILPPKPLPSQAVVAPPPSTPAAPAFNIPLKYYGFAKAKGRSIDGNRGLFLDGDNILIGAEGDLLERHFLIVALTPTMARLEDTSAKRGQDIPVTPEAPPAQ